MVERRWVKRFMLPARRVAAIAGVITPTETLVPSAIRPPSRCEPSGRSAVPVRCATDTAGPGRMTASRAMRDQNPHAIRVTGAEASHLPRGCARLSPARPNAGRNQYYVPPR